MATSVDTSRFSDLKARLSAIYCELLEDDSDDAGRYYIVEGDFPMAEFSGLVHAIRDLEHWLKPAETGPTLVSPTAGRSRVSRTAPTNVCARPGPA